MPKSIPLKRLIRIKDVNNNVHAVCRCIFRCCISDDDIDIDKRLPISIDFSDCELDVIDQFILVNTISTSVTPVYGYANSMSFKNGLLPYIWCDVRLASSKDFDIIIHPMGSVPGIDNNVIVQQLYTQSSMTEEDRDLIIELLNENEVRLDAETCSTWNLINRLKES